MIQPLGAPSPTTPAPRPSRPAAAGPPADPVDAVRLSAAPAPTVPPGLARMALAHAAAGAASGPAGAVASEADRQLLKAALPELKRATYPGKAEDLLALASEPAGATPLGERLQAMQALAQECRAADNTVQAYREAREHSGARPLVQVAAEIAALVDASDTRRGVAAFHFLEDQVSTRPPTGMDGAAARQAFMGLVAALRDPEAATRLWTRLEGADLPEPPAERLRLLVEWHKAGDMYNNDLEAGLEAILRHRRGGESFQAATASYLQLAGALKNRREAPRAYDLLRRHTAAPGPGSITPAEKDGVIRAWLQRARNAEEAEKLFEAAVAAPDEGEFLDRLDVQRTLLDRSAQRGWSGGTVADAYRRLAPESGPIMTEPTQRLLRLVPLTSGDEEAAEIRDGLLAAPGWTYEQKETAWTTLQSAVPDLSPRPESTLDDLRFLMRRVGPSGDLQVAADRLAGYFAATRDGDEARVALEVAERDRPGPAFERLLAAGGQARAARDAARLATSPEAEQFLADLMARHRARDEDGVVASVRLADSLLSLPGSAPGTLAAASGALARLPKLEEWKDAADGGFGRYVQRSVLAGAPDQGEAVARLEDLATLKETVGGDREDLEAVWDRFGTLPTAERRELVAALQAMRAVGGKSLEKDLDDLDYLARALRPGDGLVGQAGFFRQLTKGSNRPRFEYERTRDWLEATGDGSPQRLGRWAAFAAAHGDMTTENARELVEVPVGSETLAEREALLWGLATGPEDLDDAVGDYRHLAEGLNPTLSLAEAVRAFDIVRRGLGGDHLQARKIFDRLEARLQAHPEERLVDLATWFASHMTLQQDPFALLDRLDEHPEDLKIERRPEEVDIGDITLPVRQGYVIGRRPRF